MDASALDLATLSEIDASEVSVLWVNDWWDGLLEATVAFQGSRCLLLIHDRSVLGTDAPLRWVLFALNPRQLAAEEHWHRLFVAHVGSHWDLTGEEHPEPTGDHSNFYDEYQKRPSQNLSDFTVIGWLGAMPTVARVSASR